MLWLVEPQQLHVVTPALFCVTCSFIIWPLPPLYVFQLCSRLTLTDLSSWIISFNVNILLGLFAVFERCLTLTHNLNYSQHHIYWLNELPKCVRIGHSWIFFLAFTRGRNKTVKPRLMMIQYFVLCDICCRDVLALSCILGVIASLLSSFSCQFFFVSR